MYQLESIQLTNPYSQVLKFYQRAIIHSVISIIDLFSINIDVFLSISWLDQSSNSMMPITSHPFGLKFPTILQHRASYFMEYIIHLELCLHESIPGSMLRFATHIRFTELCFTCSTLPQNYLFRSQSFDRTKKNWFRWSHKRKPILTTIHTDHNSFYRVRDLSDSVQEFFIAKFFDAKRFRCTTDTLHCRRMNMIYIKSLYDNFRGKLLSSQ